MLKKVVLFVRNDDGLLFFLFNKQGICKIEVGEAPVSFFVIHNFGTIQAAPLLSMLI